MIEARQFSKGVCIAVCAALILQLSACGYIMYPERRGQKHTGQIDPAVAILDALGLLFFIVPGVIAFAVDITNGTLYLPSGRRSSSSPAGAEDVTVIRINPDELDAKKIQELVEKYAGVSIRPDLSDVEIYEVDRSEDVVTKLAELRKSGYRKD